MPAESGIHAGHCVSAVSGRPRGGDDPTPFGSSQVVDLTGERNHAAATIQLRGSCPLTVELVDTRTGDPLAKEYLLLRSAQGIPIARGSSGFRTWTDERGLARFAALPTGKYRLEVGPRGWWYYLRPESVRTVEVELTPGREHNITVRYARSKPTQP